MLKHIGLNEYGEKIQNSVLNVLKEKICLTKDLGGTATTNEFTNAIIKVLTLSNVEK